jgi:hypothetical protein
MILGILSIIILVGTSCDLLIPKWADELNNPHDPANMQFITSFNFTNPPANGVVNEENQTIAVTVPYGTSVTALIPTISHIGASIFPPSGVARNFSTPQIYTVVLVDGFTHVYTVTVTIDNSVSTQPTKPSSTSIVTSFVNFKMGETIAAFETGENKLSSELSAIGQYRSGNHYSYSLINLNTCTQSFFDDTLAYIATASKNYSITNIAIKELLQTKRDELVVYSHSYYENVNWGGTDSVIIYAQSTAATNIGNQYIAWALQFDAQFP